MSMEIVYNTAPDDLDVDGRNREIRTMLHHGVCEITFTKVNGETRTMPCTLDSALLPPQPLKEFHETRLYKPETLSVWCLDKMEWRSFRVANVTRIVRTQ
jgi:WYL_2, Sm-like SH3 beta-barrel fold